MNSLILREECASGQDIQNRTSEEATKGFSAKHYGLSTIVVTHQLTSVAKPYSENISKLVAFYTVIRNDMKTIVHDYFNGADKAEADRITKQLKEHKYARQEVNLRHQVKTAVEFPEHKNDIMQSWCARQKTLWPTNR